ncbi:unnamed protein product [Laminaria digitata]
MLLDARSGDVGLWAPILTDACRHHGLRRALIMRVFPRVVRSRVADAFARNGARLAPLWEEVMVMMMMMTMMMMLLSHYRRGPSIVSACATQQTRHYCGNRPYSTHRHYRLFLSVPSYFNGTTAATGATEGRLL